MPWEMIFYLYAFNLEVEDGSVSIGIGKVQCVCPEQSWPVFTAVVEKDISLQTSKQVYFVKKLV